MSNLDFAHNKQLVVALLRECWQHLFGTYQHAQPVASFGILILSDGLGEIATNRDTPPFDAFHLHCRCDLVKGL